MWKVYNVTDMSYMFMLCEDFNQPIIGWITGPDSAQGTNKVTNMRTMFKGCKKFNQSLKNFRVDSVIDMEEMFFGCESFNGELGSWTLSSVSETNGFRRMFYGCSSFDQDLNKWCTDDENENTCPRWEWSVSGDGMFTGASKMTLDKIPPFMKNKPAGVDGVGKVEESLKATYDPTYTGRSPWDFLSPI